MADSENRQARRHRPAASTTAGSTPPTGSPPAAVRWIQWGSLVLAAVLLLVFLLSQRQTADILYGNGDKAASSDSADSGGSDSDSSDSDAPDPSTGHLPSDAELKQLMAKSAIVRLPGAVAAYDEPTVLAAITRADAALAKLEEPEPKISVIVTAPDLSKADTKRLYHLPGNVMKVIGLTTSFAGNQVAQNDIQGWERQFATGDVTSDMLTLIATHLKAPKPPDRPPLARRTPTAAELEKMLPALRKDRLYAAPGATLDQIPKVAAEAFPQTPPVVVALPQQPRGEPLPDYPAALSKAFPDTPVMVMYGNWIGYAGPYADSSRVAAAGYYGVYADLIAENNYPQWNVLNVYLQEWASMRFSGIYDRPLPYSPPDPLGVAFPALPWVFLGCVLIFVGVSVHTVRRRDGSPGDAAAVPPAAESASQWVRLAGLSSLALEVSPLTDSAARAPLTRGIKRLTAARSGLERDRPDALINSQLAAAEREFDAVATAVGRPEYRPEQYLAGRSS